MNQLKAGAILNYIVIILNTLVGLLYTPYMLRMMGQSEYGLYSLVASVIAYLTVLDLGLGNAIIRYTSKFRAEGKVKEQYEMFGMFLILYLCIGLIALIAGLGLYYNIDSMFGETMTLTEINHARIMMLILVVNLVITFPMSIFGSIITAYERFVFPKIINIARVILNTLVMIILLHMGYKAIAMVLVQTLFNIISLFINYIYCKRELHIEIHYGRFKWGFLKEIAIYSFWIFLNVIMDKIYWSTGQFVLGAVAGTVAVSVFAIAIHLEGLYMTFSSAISSVFLPRVTGMVSLNNDSKEISDLFIRTGRIQNVIMSLILLGFIIFGKQFIELWAGKEYSSAYAMSVLFFISLYIPLIQNLGITILQARNQMMFRSLLYVVIAIIALVAEILLAKRMGGIGCAIAIASALFIGQGIIMNIYYLRVQKLAIVDFWRQIIKMNFLPTLFSVLSFFVVNRILQIDTWLKLALGLSVFTLLYLPVCFVSLNEYEKQLVLSPVKRISKYAKKVISRD